MIDPRIIVAIDTFDLKQANAILDQLDPDLCMIKIGSVVFNAFGKSFLQHASSKGFKIFLDLKLHDIPNTIYETILGFNDCKIDMLTVHLSGICCRKIYQSQGYRGLDTYELRGRGFTGFI